MSVSQADRAVGDGIRFKTILNTDVMNGHTNPYLLLEVHLFFKRVGVGDRRKLSDPRIQMRQVDGALKACFPSAGDTATATRPEQWLPITDWPAHVSWTDWQDTVVRRVKSVWAWKLTLLSPQGKSGLLYWGPPGSGSMATHQGNVECALEVLAVSSPRSAHRTVEVVYPDVTQSGFKQFDFRSHIDLYSAYDTELMTKEVVGSQSIQQYVAAHEAGHAVGLDHIGKLKNHPACLAAVDLNADPCYGRLGLAGTRIDVDMASNVMGLGNEVTPDDAVPWAVEMATRSGSKAEDWKAVRWAPGQNLPRKL